MASGSAGESGAPVPTTGAPDEVPQMRETMEWMIDSIITLQTQMAALMEDPNGYQGDQGPAVRARVYDHASESDRINMSEMEEAINKNVGRLDDLESALAFYSSELTGDRDEISKIDDALRDLRNDTSPNRSTGTGDRRDRQVVTEIRGFDKLKAHNGAATQWKEWRFRVSTWLTQSSTSFDTLMVKVDAS